jgi:hypothetical protein
MEQSLLLTTQHQAAEVEIAGETILSQKGRLMKGGTSSAIGGYPPLIGGYICGRLISH